ncbi:MAG: hypothetical protein AB1646_15510 [Thermodesulfobacteriota bacterium]
MKSHWCDWTVPREIDPGLNAMILEEMKQLRAKKEEYDLDFPQHQRFISNWELWHIARKKIIEQLCDARVRDEDGIPALCKGDSFRLISTAKS